MAKKFWLYAFMAIVSVGMALNACDVLRAAAPVVADVAGAVAAAVTPEQRAKASLLAPGLPPGDPLLEKIAAGIARVEAAQEASTRAILAAVKPCSCPVAPAPPPPNVDLSAEALRALQETRDATEALRTALVEARVRDAGADSGDAG